MLIFLLIIYNCEYSEKRKILFVIQEKTDQAFLQEGLQKCVEEKKMSEGQGKEKRKMRLRNASVEFFTSIGPGSHLKKISSAFPYNILLGYPSFESFP